MASFRATKAVGVFWRLFLCSLKPHLSFNQAEGKETDRSIPKRHNRELVGKKVLFCGSSFNGASSSARVSLYVGRITLSILISKMATHSQT